MNKNIPIAVFILAVLAVGVSFFFSDKSDASRFSKNFLRCTPSELKMSFPGSTLYVVTVVGIENDLCHYTAKIVDQSNTALQSGPSGIDCRVPQARVTADTLDHILGQDKTPNAAAEQAKLQTDYCTKAIQ